MSTPVFNPSELRQKTCSTVGLIRWLQSKKYVTGVFGLHLLGTVFVCWFQMVKTLNFPSNNIPMAKVMISKY